MDGIKSHPDFVGYGASEDGRVWSSRRRGPSGLVGNAWKEIRPRKNRQGYLRFDVRINRSAATVSAHRFVLEVFVGPCPEGMQACHNNGIRSDNRLANLRWDTGSSNQHDRILHGTDGRGERHWNAKLSESDVVAIRQLRADGVSTTTISQMFEVSDVTACYICSGKTWVNTGGPITKRVRAKAILRRSAESKN